MKYNYFKFHAFRKVSFLFAECICNLILQYIQVLCYNLLLVSD